MNSSIWASTFWVIIIASIVIAGNKSKSQNNDYQKAKKFALFPIFHEKTPFIIFAPTAHFLQNKNQ
jgi:hypothetical protein